MKRTRFSLLGLLIVLSMGLAACGAPATEAPTAAPPPTAVPPTAAPTAVPPTEVPTAIPWTAPEGALVSMPANAAPTLDGAADDAAWQDAPETTIAISGGFNGFETDVSLRSVYSGDTVYFVASWADPTESFIRSPWEKQPDGSWAKVKDPNDRGGDNNLVYEDKMAFIWPINNSIPGFDKQGCFTACHAGENSDAKPYGNKYTAEAGQLGDIWHWKSVRNVGQIDDQYLDDVRYSPDTVEAGRHSDKKDGGGYVDNQTEDKKFPAFMLPEGSAKDGFPGYILDSEKVPFDDSKFAAGDRIPSIIVSPMTGDRGDISAAWKWADGQWTLEFARKLVTGSETDVQFDDLDATYYFGVAVFENAQVRHAFQGGATPFVFQPAE